jgi:YVTN family beta-propeller protein
LVLGVLALVALLAPVAPGQYYAYVTNYGEEGSHVKGSVSIIDLATNSVVATVPVGVSPQGVVANPAGTAVYVANTESNDVTVINTATRATTTIPAGNGPVGIAVHPNGRRIYVANADHVLVIDRATNTIIDKIVSGTRPIALAVHPDGSVVYVANVMDGTVAVVDAKTDKVIDTIKLEPTADDEGWGSFPVPIVVHPDGTYVYVANRLGSTLWAINTATHECIARSFAQDHCGIAINPAGTVLYLPDYAGLPEPPTGTTMDVIDARTLERITTIKGLAGPVYVAVHPEGTRLYITNSLGDSVAVLNAATYEVVADIPVGKCPQGFGEFIGPGVPRLLMDDAAARLGAVKGAVAAGAEGVNSQQEALKSLETALTAATGYRLVTFWSVGSDGVEDPRRLRRVEGTVVFASERKMVEAIFDALRRGWIVNRELETELLAIVDEIVRADRVLAAVAIDDAITAKAEAAGLDQAQELLKEADASAKQAAVWPQPDKKTILFQDAIGQYKEAWEAARKLVP